MSASISTEELKKVWLEFIEAQNNSSRPYDDKVAAHVIEQIIQFQSQVQKFISNLRALS